MGHFLIEPSANVAADADWFLIHQLADRPGQGFQLHLRKSGTTDVKALYGIEWGPLHPAVYLDWTPNVAEGGVTSTTNTADGMAWRYWSLDALNEALRWNGAASWAGMTALYLRYSGAVGGGTATVQVDYGAGYVDVATLDTSNASLDHRKWLVVNLATPLTATCVLRVIRAAGTARFHYPVLFRYGNVGNDDQRLIVQASPTTSRTKWDNSSWELAMSVKPSGGTTHWAGGYYHNQDADDCRQTAVTHTMNGGAWVPAVGYLSTVNTIERTSTVDHPDAAGIATLDEAYTLSSAYTEYAFTWTNALLNAEVTVPYVGMIRGAVGTTDLMSDFGEHSDFDTNPTIAVQRSWYDLYGGGQPYFRTRLVSFSGATWRQNITVSASEKYYWQLNETGAMAVGATIKATHRYSASLGGKMTARPLLQALGVL